MTFGRSRSQRTGFPAFLSYSQNGWMVRWKLNLWRVIVCLMASFQQHPTVDFHSMGQLGGREFMTKEIVAC
jgi:hypothetical protein